MDNYTATEQAYKNGDKQKKKDTVKHGQWKEADDGDGIVCSVCRNDFCNIYLEIDRFNYCPNCGAKMDGKSNVPRTEGE